MISYTVFGGRLNIDEEQLCMSAGCGSVIQNLAFLLLDDGDGVILPTPTYAALYHGIQRCLLGVSWIAPAEADDHHLSLSALSAAFARGVESGHRPRMLLLCNPNNPLGTVYSKELSIALAFCEEHRCTCFHRIYANSVFPGSPDSFQSVAEILAFAASPSQADAHASTTASANHDSFLEAGVMAGVFQRILECQAIAWVRFSRTTASFSAGTSIASRDRGRLCNMSCECTIRPGALVPS